VVTAVANGDLNQKFVLESAGRGGALAETINDMTDTLRTFAEQVTTRGSEVGIEGTMTLTLSVKIPPSPGNLQATLAVRPASLDADFASHSCDLLGKCRTCRSCRYRFRPTATSPGLPKQTFDFRSPFATAVTI